MKKILIIASLALFSAATMAKPISAEKISPKVELVKVDNHSAFDLATPNFVINVVDMDLSFVTVKAGEVIAPLYAQPVSNLVTFKGFDEVAYMPPNLKETVKAPRDKLRYRCNYKK